MIKAADCPWQTQNYAKKSVHQGKKIGNLKYLSQESLYSVYLPEIQ